MTSKLSRRVVLGGLAALPACRASTSKLDAQIIVLGAGLAGLHTARLLSAEGKDVLVLEGSSRIGGRVHTLDHGELGFTEGGGAKIDPGAKQLIETARQLDVTLIADDPTPRSTAYYYRGKNYTTESWRALKDPPFPPPFEKSLPSEPLRTLAAKANPLKTAQDWMNPKFNSFDISAQDFLSEAGFNGDAQKLIDQTLKGNSLRSYSMMNIYRRLYLDEASRRLGPSLSVQGGAQRLPEAMAASLPKKVKTGQTIKSITVETDKVIIETASGKTFNAEKCICALPFGALRHVAIKAFMPEAQSAAIRELPYTQVLQIHMNAQSAFWEQDGLPADMWTDLPVERILAERDNGGTPNGVFRAIINGRGATRSVWDNRANLPETVKAYMKTVRPASGGEFDILAVEDWTKSNTLAGGAYMHWAPGQISQWAEPMASRGANLFFAGAHLSREQTGMEGAMESAEIAARQILNG
ncbi:FAD-dependent oxidoreductase [Hellea sp.]|nr:FAD-dependent oxidoreductase [Hellea sp.]